MSEISPFRWLSIELGEAAKFIDYRGKTPKKVSAGVPLITAKNIRKGYIDREPREFIEESAYDEWMTRGIPEVGDILITTEAPLGNVAQVDIGERFALAQRSICLQFYVKPVEKYVAYFLQSPYFQVSLEGESTGTTVKGIKASKLKKLQVPMPPLAEQLRIAQKLDLQLAQVESIKARVDAIPVMLKRFRQSVLAAAVSGKITEGWRENNQSNNSVDKINSEISQFRYKLWEEGQYEKFRNKGKIPKNDKWKEKYKEPVFSDDTSFSTLPAGWVHQPLDGLVYIAARIGWKGLKASEYTKEGPLFLSVHSLNYGQHVKLDEAYHISQSRYEESPEIMLKNDDILLCKDGAGIGKVSILKNLKEPATINSSLLLIRSGEYFITEYLYYFFAGPRMQSLVQERMTGTAVPHLFQRDVKEFVLEVPPIAEQKEIVRRVEQYFALADQIEAKVSAAQKHINHLTQSILAKAFRGELVPQDPNDEPAEKLLERIKAQRKKEQLKKNAKSKKKE